ncbi:MAG TPA: DUF1697 domain-containing protein [Phycisphaerae bacterium]|nr:DUF1697 domain-containing protein [Phycisphaerae bacterium]
MSSYIALLRGINVGGHNLIGMSDLRAMLESLGFTGVKSLLQSGNLVFQAGKRSPESLERLLESETKKRLKAAPDYFVRTADEWQTLIDRNPFPKEAKSDPSHLLVVFLKDAPDAKLVKALQAAIKGPEIVRADGRHLYAVYPAGIGRSKLTNTLIEKSLATRGTARNWNTIIKLSSMLTLPSG